MEENSELKSKNSSYFYLLGDYWKSGSDTDADECLEKGTYTSEEKHRDLLRKASKIEGRISKEDLVKLVKEFEIPDYYEIGGRIVYIYTESEGHSIRHSGTIKSINPRK